MPSSALHAVRSPRPRAALLAFVLCAALLAHAEPPPAGHTCIHDQIAALQRASQRAAGRPAVQEVRLAPLREHGGNALTRLYDVFFAAGAAVGEWQPIRIAVFTHDLYTSGSYCKRVGDVVNDHSGSLSCGEEDVLTEKKRSVLKDKMIKEAVKLHADRLLVQPIKDRILVPTLEGVVCGLFSVPSDHQTEGIGDADFLLYVRGGPTSGNTIAWALTCAFLRPSRPIVGVTNISPKYIKAGRFIVRVVAHEILHSLGFNDEAFKKHSMMTQAPVRGKASAPLITSATVKSKAREHYNCDSISGMELEDAGGQGTALSHWKLRNAKDELMAGYAGAGFYTAITIAAMEDTGYYRGNYNMAEAMGWGYKVGCVLLEKKCVVDGVSQVPSMFCTEQGTASCTSDHLALGECTGAMGPAMDGCPTALPYSDGWCTGVSAGVIPGSLFGSSARCFDGVSITAVNTSQSMPGVCAEVQCDNGTFKVRVKGAADFVGCPAETTLQLPQLSKEFTSGTITCPRYIDVCGYKDGFTDSAAPGAAAAVTTAVLMVALLSLVV